MSMSGFEKEWDDQRIDSSLLLRQELGLPEDFTDEDIAFAQEMNTLFSLDTEEMPPYYVQTLLDAENPRLQPAAHGLEYKTLAHVFRRLKLRRRLFHPKPVSFSFVAQLQHTRPHRSILALLVACCFFVFFTVVATGPSFASGLEVLLSGHHGGVLQVNGYPHLFSESSNTSPSTVVAHVAVSKKINILEAQGQLTFAINRPLAVPDHYVLSSMYLYQGIDQSWADGPALELNYSYMRQGALSQGTGQISVCEFRPKGQVLQIVQLGAAHSIQLGRNDHAQGIYVDGQWVRVNKYSHDWIYGGRSEIIYEHNGVIYWIAGDQRDGIDQKVLTTIASSLQPFNMHAMQVMGHSDQVTVAPDNSTWPFADDIVYTNEPDGSSLEIISTDPASSSVHIVPGKTSTP